jgi:hypothetical protein
MIVHNRFSRPGGMGPGQELHRWEPNRRSQDSADTVLTHTQDADYAMKLEYIRKYGGSVGDDR